MANKKNDDRQMAFAAEYIIDWNAKQAAIRAGYAEASAEVRGSQLIRNSNVRSEIERLLAERVPEKNEIIQRNIEHLKRIAYRDPEEEGKNEQAQIKAMELLGKYAGMFTDKLELSGGLQVNVNRSVVTGEIEDRGTVKRSDSK